MSELEFEDKNLGGTSEFVPASQKGMIGFLIKKGIVKDERTAQIVLICVSVVFFALSFYFFTN